MNSVKTYFIQFTNKSTPTSDIQIMHDDKRIRTAIETKFFGCLLIILFLVKHTL